MAELTAQEKQEAAEALRSKGQCVDCGGIHARACPRVKKVRTTYSTPFGSLQQQFLLEREVEYFPHGEWPLDGVVFPEDVYEELEAGPAADEQQQQEPTDAH